MTKIRVVGFDPSLRNWGVAKGHLDFHTNALDIDTLDTIQPVLPKGKQIRVNSKDLAAATWLSSAVNQAIQDANAIFVEIPHGSQSARAMASYGICVGILGALSASGRAFYELTALEVKLQTGNRAASKQEVIDWAIQMHPEAPWPYKTINGQQTINKSKAEHVADAVTVIHAGVQSPAFQQMKQLIVAA